MKQLRLWAMLVAMSSSPLIFAQGGGGNNNQDERCKVKARITGENRPVPGETYTYNHSFDEYINETMVWTVEGAQSVDGTPTNNERYTVEKIGRSVDVVWNNDKLGFIKSIPANPCTDILDGYPQDGWGAIVSKLIGNGTCPPIADLTSIEWGRSTTCSNGMIQAIALEPSATHDTYIWTKDGIPVNTTSNSWMFQKSPTAPDDEIYVKAVDACGNYSNEISRTIYYGGMDNHFPAVDTPAVYCGENGTTFSIAPLNRYYGVEYRWEFNYATFDGDSGTIVEAGWEKHEFTPDFGVSSDTRSPRCVNNGNFAYGNVMDFVLRVNARNCWTSGGSQFSSTTEVIENNIDYSQCCQSASNPQAEFSIDLLPNPAADRVTIKLPQGGATKNLRIVDAYGQTRKDINTNKGAENVNISDLPMGNYTVIVSDGTNIATEHLTKLP